jgi:hypothetical protein
VLWGQYSSKVIIAGSSAPKRYDFPISISMFAQLKRPSSEEKLRHDYQMTMPKLSKRQFIYMEWHAESSSEDCMPAYRGLRTLNPLINVLRYR